VHRTFDKRRKLFNRGESRDKLGRILRQMAVKNLSRRAEIFAIETSGLQEE